MSTNINGILGAYATGAASTSKTEAKVETKKESKKEIKASGKEEQGAVYEKSTSEKKATYSINKMSAEDRAAIVEQMKQDQVNRKQQLCDLVNQMLSKQADVSNLASLFSPENLKNVSPEAIAQAKEDVSEDGYWGVKQTSQRLFDFASALAGDDVEKMKEMQEAMEKGFKQATKAWGEELPSICQDTIDAANKLFDEYYKSKETN